MKLKWHVPPRLTFTPLLPSLTCPGSALRDAEDAGDVVNVCIIPSWPLLIHPGLLCRGYSSLRRDPHTLVGVLQEEEISSCPSSCSSLSRAISPPFPLTPSCSVLRVSAVPINACPHGHPCSPH